MTRTIDELGRVVIPGELREQLGWKEKDVVEFVIENDAIVMRLETGTGTGDE
ncbi:MAG: AbrB/MazE/SpoVT family DNA-binding domain-containing protein [Defluviitaleaceae bacterium]|nr:AbrB/MazE/SpoVT family DNA-binding domain-containing protein [Defluviitaleaceae bacterium]